MPGPAPLKEDFASILSRAQQVPEVADGNGKDLPDGFPFEATAHHKVVDTTKDEAGIEGVVAYDFTCFRQVFLIYRPWDSCKRCAQDMGNNIVQLPAEGDYTCPHTDLVKYQGIVNKALAGEFLMGPENEVVQKDGSIVISMKWFEKKVSTRRKKGRPGGGGPRQQDEPDL
jgi:hypothetical protein